MTIKQIGETVGYKFSLKTTPELMSENKVGLFVPDLFIQFYYPLDKAPTRIKERLLSGAVLTPEFEVIRKQLHDTTNDAPYFIHSLLTHWFIDDETFDLSEEGYTTIGTTKKVPLLKFVSAPGHKNIFFVIEHLKEEDKLRCIEVHKIKPMTYRIVKLKTSQVTLTERITRKEKQLSIEEAIYLDYKN